MSELSHDMISQIASRLFQDAVSASQQSAPVSVPGASSIPGFGSLPSPSIPGAVPSIPPIMPAGIVMPMSAPTASPSVPAFPGMPGAPASLPTVPMMSQGQPDVLSPLLALNSGFGQMPAPLADSAHSGTGGTLNASETQGISAFVAKVRALNYSSDTGLCESSQTTPEGMSFRRAAQASGTTGRALDVNQIRRDFPALNQQVHGKQLVWFDNAATTQKPQSVIDAMSTYYSRDNSNIHRAAHTLAARSTDAYEGARQKIQRFIGAGSAEEIIFVRGTTEGINLVAQTMGRHFLRPGDEIVLSTLEHHANIVPWQMVARETGAVIRVIPVNDHGEILLDAYESLLGPQTKIVSLTHASNSLGTILPIESMIRSAKRWGAQVLIDGAQTVAHLPVNVQSLGCDYFVFSGHKIFAPTGIGALYVRKELQQVMPPWQGGGNMIRNVTFEQTTYSDPPAKFEAGTPSIGDAVGLGAALDYVTRLGLPAIAQYEHQLLEYGTARLNEIPGLRLIGTAKEKVGVLSFVLPNRRPEDIGKMLDAEGIAVRSGHHCSQPSLRRFGLEATVRPSLAFYNTKEEIDRLADAVRRIVR
ncbi:MAG: SufS family cysteine desulfurase [Planctomycetaceae bacterium]|nr:SufS family cysteine desulfurase [Planctomycetaceae bacterium]